MPENPVRVALFDTLRGLSILGMILVNHPGNPAQVFPQIRHAEWHGWTLADLIAPGFLWIVGVVIPFAIGKHFAAGLKRGWQQTMILRRCATLYALGVLVDILTGLSYFIHETALVEIPVLGILQRIAVCYLAAASIFLWWRMRGVISATLAFLGLYIGVLCVFLFLCDPTDPFAPQANFATWTDSLILGVTLNASQGLVTTLTGTVTTLSGVAFGYYLQPIHHTTDQESLTALLIGAWSIVLSEILDTWIPINRYLWTPSFVLFTMGVSMALFATLAHFSRWNLLVWAAKPFTVVGRNPIMIYCLAGILHALLTSVGTTGPQREWKSLWTLGYEQFLLLNLPPKVASLAMAATYAVILYSVARFLDQRKWYIRV